MAVAIDGARLANPQIAKVHRRTGALASPLIILEPRRTEKADVVVASQAISRACNTLISLHRYSAVGGQVGCVDPGVS